MRPLATDRSATLFFAIFVLILVVLPGLSKWLHQGLEAPFWHLNGDSFLYLGIAEASPWGFYSFDGETPTNGFHPGWQFYCWLVTLIFGNAPLLVMNIVALSNLALTAVGTFLTGMAIRRATGSWLLAGLTVPGVYFLFVGQTYGGLSVWNTFSGMENGAALAVTGALLLHMVGMSVEDRSFRPWIVLGLWLALLMFIRLDEVFVGPAIAAAVLLSAPRDALARLPRVVAMGVPMAVVLAVYFAYNLTTVGELMPVSGAAKGEGSLLSNGWVTTVHFVSPVFDLREALTDYTGNIVALQGAGFRVSQLVFPACFALLFILLLRHGAYAHPWSAILTGLLFGILIKNGYTFLVSNYWHQASWYFAFSMGVLNFAAAVLLAPLVSRFRAVAPWGFRGVVAIYLLVTLSMAGDIYSGGASENNGNRDFWRDRASIEQILDERAPGEKVLEFGDGIVNYALERPVRHGFMFAGHPEGLESLRNGTLLRDSHADGYSLLSAVGYWRFDPEDQTLTSDEIAERLRNTSLDDRVKAELEFFTFELVHVYAPTWTPFIRMTPRG
jgi:hypothetical protein